MPAPRQRHELLPTDDSVGPADARMMVSPTLLIVVPCVAVIVMCSGAIGVAMLKRPQAETTQREQAPIALASSVIAEGASPPISASPPAPPPPPPPTPPPPPAAPPPPQNPPPRHSPPPVVCEWAAGGGINLGAMVPPQLCSYFHDDPSRCERAFLPHASGKIRRCVVSATKHCTHGEVVARARPRPQPHHHPPHAQLPTLTHAPHPGGRMRARTPTAGAHAATIVAAAAAAASRPPSHAARPTAAASSEDNPLPVRGRREAVWRRRVPLGRAGPRTLHEPSTNPPRNFHEPSCTNLHKPSTRSTLRPGGRASRARVSTSRA